jgi:DNA helicase-2/ATP-dependent DNA helicase PcrA
MDLSESQLSMFGTSGATVSRRRGPTAPPDAALLERIADRLSLNAQQLAVVTSAPQPALVIAGAGSGKTNVLVRRAAWLIAHGIRPEQVLLITFTRKAASEMLSRVQEFLPRPDLKVQGGTFHSMAHSWLRTHGHAIKLSPKFTIMDESDAAALLHLLASKLGLIGVKGFPDKRTLLAIIGHAANSLLPITQTIETTFPELMAHQQQILTLHRLFIETKWTQQRFDYDDLLLLVHQLLMEEPAAGYALAQQYRAVLVDEYQDSTRLQAELVRLLARQHQNVMVVGDDAQCVMMGTRILTPGGYVPVESLAIGSLVLSAGGAGHLVPKAILNKTISQHPDYIEIQTKRGYTIKVSPNHLCFGKIECLSGYWYVYLIYRRNIGFRIGITKLPHQLRTTKAIQMRTARQEGERLWLIEAHSSRQEAQFREEYFSLKYQIPQALYQPEKRCMREMTDLQAETLFREFGTNGYRLLKDYQLSFDYPTYTPKASRSKNRLSINLVMASNHKRKARCQHELYVESHLGWESVKDRSGVTGGEEYWRLRKYSSDYKVLLHEAHDLHDRLTAAGYAPTIVYRAKFGNSFGSNGSYVTFPAAGLLPGMLVPVVTDTFEILQDTIQAVKRLPNSSQIPFYDLEIEHTHNIVSDKIITHNSIYAFRSANVRNMLEFPTLFPGTVTHTLEQNYRSSEPILQLANAILAEAQHVYPKRLFSTRQSGRRPLLVQCPDESAQSEYVVRQLQALLAQGVALHRIAVLVRLSSHSYNLETVLARHQLPFTKYGGLALTETAHVKDLRAYLQIAEHPADTQSWHRVLLLLDRVGPKTAQQLITAMRGETHPLDVLRNDSSAADQSLHRLAELITLLRDDALPVGLRLQSLLEHYDRVLTRHYPTDAAQRRAELNQLCASGKDSPSIQDFLQILAEQEAPSDSGPRHDNTLVLSTIHSAKGLEWDVVFVINLLDTRLPYIRSWNDPASLEEERRLLYVAVTRPRHILILTYPLGTYDPYGGTAMGTCSRFLEHIPDTILDRLTVEAA